MYRIHGGDVYNNIIDLDFSTSLSPLGYPKVVSDAIVRELSIGARYPDPDCKELSNKFEEATGLVSDQLLWGNGAAELIYAICAYISVSRSHKCRSLVIGPTFTEYEAATLAAGGEVSRFELSSEKGFAFDRDVIDRISTDCDLVFICNPNNPTGRLYELEDIAYLLDACVDKNAILVVDECFMPFIREAKEYTACNLFDNTGSALLSNTGRALFNKIGRSMSNNVVRSARVYSEHLIVLGAFTKIYAMAGIRLGFALCGDNKLREGIRGMMQPWNVSALSQAAGIAALEDKEYVDAAISYVEKEKEYLVRELCKLQAGNVGKDVILETCGIEKADKVDKIEVVSSGECSRANFIFFSAAEDMGRRLLGKGIMIRDCRDMIAGDKYYYRIGIRTHEENERLIRCIREVCNG